MTLNDKLMLEIANCEAVTFLGLAKMLNVPLMNEDKTPRDFSEIFEGVLARYSSLNRKLKKDILKVLKDANSTKDTDSTN